ncbi:uncharacterized protein LOC111412703 [Olea europaea var. sylvestris]|uniref:uncharacterized protein LOC111412703 n=1 Tax=Olea europaea var. sylvestris TaxID=158386 RepID=UPI000C1D7F19|nr:uncharacterized protein LOC111412703 [Olea europaea var. sylvestris]
MEPLHEKLKIPQIAAYEGDGDPLSHHDKYTSWMELQEASNAIMCRAFPLTLGDKAQRWFRRLHERLVKNWNDLATVFLAQFMGFKAETTQKERLVSINQGRSESLKSYMTRFNKQSMEVEKISDDAALMAVLAGLRPRTRFWWSVHKDGPMTYHKFLNRAEKYISTEEATSDQEEETSEPDLNNTVKEKKPSAAPSPKKRRTGEKENVLGLSHTNFESTTHSKSPWKRIAGHDTDNCRDLKEEVESLIRRGRLQKFVAKPKEADPPTTQQPLL